MAPQKPQYIQAYRTAWEKLPELKDWLRPDVNNKSRAICKFCKLSLAARLHDLKNHAKTEKHVAAAKPFICTRQMKIDFPSQNENNKRHVAECRLALYAAVHTSILSIDHLTEACNKLFKDSEATPLKMHRSKCGNVIRNVLGPHFQEQLREDILDGPYSLIIDEATDINVSKMLGVVVKYFSTSHNTVITTYLSLVELEKSPLSKLLNLYCKEKV